ncbi:MAG TPA: TRAP transporter large permease [Ramlibacter sp.]|nr:TRAP transporter large permease [Ramlibacter sp.]
MPGVVLAIMFSMLVLAIPVGLSIGLAGILGLFANGGLGMLQGVLENTPLSSVGVYDLMVIPLFILMAEFIMLSGVADDLFRAASVWLGRLPGGLAIATSVAGSGFGAICGTSTACAATLSATSLPAMLKEGYEPKMAAGVVSISGTLAMLVPPSVALILYGLIAEVSIGKLLIAGLIPALVVTATIIATILFLVWRDPSCAPASRSTTWKEKFASLRGTWAVVVLFGTVTGAIYMGVATAVEAAGLGAAGALLIAAVRGKVRLHPICRAISKAMSATCMIFMIMLGAALFGYFFTMTQVTQDLVAWVGTLPVSRWVIIVVLLAGYLVLGCFLDQIAILFLTVPLVVPIVVSLGFDPVWFGVVKVVTAEVGMITPPIGLNCFIVARYSGRPVWEVFQGCYPHFIAHLFAIAILVAFPALSLWLPGQMR